MERVEIEGQVATAHTMAMLFSAIPPSRSGPVDIFIVDIHALQERFYFDPRSSGPFPPCTFVTSNTYLTPSHQLSTPSPPSKSS